MFQREMVRSPGPRDLGIRQRLHSRPKKYILPALFSPLLRPRKLELSYVAFFRCFKSEPVVAEHKPQNVKRNQMRLKYLLTARVTRKIEFVKGSFSNL